MGHSAGELGPDAEPALTGTETGRFTHKDPNFEDRRNVLILPPFVPRKWVIAHRADFGKYGFAWANDKDELVCEVGRELAVRGLPPTELVNSPPVGLVPRTLSWRHCQCGSPVCKLQYPAQLGQFYQGTGFLPHEVELINMAWDAMHDNLRRGWLCLMVKAAPNVPPWFGLGLTEEDARNRARVTLIDNELGHPTKTPTATEMEQALVGWREEYCVNLEDQL
jgi:hypothetical protein